MTTTTIGAEVTVGEAAGNHPRGEVRVCDTTGLAVCATAERFIKLHAVFAVVSLLIGGIAAILIGLTRWPAVHLLPADWYYRLVTLHGLDMLIVMILNFEIAILYFAGAVLLNSRLYSKSLSWATLALMLVGAVMCNATVLMGKADRGRRPRDLADGERLDLRPALFAGSDHRSIDTYQLQDATRSAFSRHLRDKALPLLLLHCHRCLASSFRQPAHRLVVDLHLQERLDEFRCLGKWHACRQAHHALCKGGSALTRDQLQFSIEGGKGPSRTPDIRRTSARRRLPSPLG